MGKGEITQYLMELFAGGTKSTNLTTSEVRRAAANEFSKLENKNVGEVLNLCEGLLETGTWAMGVIAYEWAFRVRDQYDKGTFKRFEHWLKKYVTG